MRSLNSNFHKKLPNNSWILTWKMLSSTGQYQYATTFKCSNLTERSKIPRFVVSIFQKFSEIKRKIHLFELSFQLSTRAPDIATPRRGGLVSRTILIPLSNTISAAIQFSGYVRNSPWSLRGRRLKLSCNVRNILTDTSPDRVLTISKMGRKNLPTSNPAHHPVCISKPTRRKLEQNTAGPSADAAL